MKTLFFGECDRRNLFALADPDAPLETDFEAFVVRALTCLYPNYDCIFFGGGFNLDGSISKPDLALVAKDFSHWFVVEVELTSHSLERHVLPQVRAFCYGDAEDDCIGHLARGLTITREQATTLLHHVPRRVVVIANRHDLEWQTSLKALGIELVVLSVFRSPTGIEAYFLEGVLDVQKESLGFGVYSAPDRSVRIHSTVVLPEEPVQIYDPDGVLGSWNVAISGNDTWITKAAGTPTFDDGSYIQLIRSVNGELRFRNPRAR